MLLYFKLRDLPSISKARGQVKKKGASVKGSSTRSTNSTQGSSYRDSELISMVLQYSLTDAAPHVRQQRILAGLSANTQILLVRFGETGILQTFPHAALIIVNRRKITVGWDFI